MPSKNLKKTMSSIAALAGVSSATVSRVFDPNKEKLVKSRTKEKILKIVEKEGFYPNLQARYLAGIPVNAIGIVLPHSSFFVNSYYITENIRGITEQAEGAGYYIMFFATKQLLSEFNYKKIYRSKTAGGFILMNTGRNERDTILELDRQKIPFVVINNYFKGTSLNYVDADNIIGAYQAVKYLLSKGHTRIACIRGHIGSRNADDRVKGYMQALSENHITVPGDYVPVGNFNEEMGKEAALMLLQLRERPTAIFASNDEMALGAINAITGQGLKIPEDIAIIGYDDSRIASIITPSLSSVSQPVYDMGVEATRILIERMKNPDMPPVRKIFPTRLVIRKSSG
jgi:DNA-binding LacI/PurR family transcriptional regulator